MDKFIIVNRFLINKHRIEGIGIPYSIYLSDEGIWHEKFNIYMESGKTFTIKLNDKKKLKEVRDDLIDLIINSD